MKNTNDHDLSFRAHSVENGMLTDEHTEVGRDLDESASQLGAVDKGLKAEEESNYVALGLSFTPAVCSECANLEHVGASPAQQSEAGHQTYLARARCTELTEHAF